MARTDHTKETIHAPPSERGKRLRIEVDFERYAHFLSKTDLSHDEKQEMLQALWSIVIGFVDLGFGVDPTQSACGQVKNTRPTVALTNANPVHSTNREIIEKFTESARPELAAKEKGFAT